MSCYLRHLQEVFDQAGIEITADDRKRADRLVHEMVGVEHKHCPQAWAEVKRRLAEDRPAFVAELGRRWKDEGR